MRVALVVALTFASACSASDSPDDQVTTADAGAPEGGGFSSSSSGGSSSSSGAPSGGSSSGGTTSSLRERVQAIMNARCTGCHGTDEPDALLDLTNVGASVNAESFEMPGQLVVKPGAPDESVLVLAVEGDPPGSVGRMPKRAEALPKTQTDAIRQWVQDGAP